MKNSSFFDAKWYLATYPDVADAGIDPEEHFNKHGKHEGRLPCNLPAIALERELWENAVSPKTFLFELERESSVDNVSGVYALKVLIEYYLFSKEYERAYVNTQKLFEKIQVAKLVFDEEELFLLQFESYFYSEKRFDAERFVNCSDWKESPSKQLARVMLADSKAKLTPLNYLFSSNKLKKIHWKRGATSFDSLCSKNIKTDLLGKVINYVFDKKVSIVVPVFNAEKTIGTSLKSLVGQTWKNIEIIVVNDSSTDKTHEILSEFEKTYPQLKVIKNRKNMGAYTSRNLGVEASVGDFVAVMDADDWAHPQKIEKQIIPLLLNQNLQATISHWVRCSDALNCSKVRAGRSWVHRNVSSLLIRKSVLSFLNGWDKVRVNADTEFYERLIAKFGKRSILEVLPDVPLSLGRNQTTSLTQTSETHLVTQFGGIRKIYMDFARMWHMNTEKYDNPSSRDDRPFPVPPEMYLGNQYDSNRDCFEYWLSALDENWYINLYDDVTKMGVGLHEHYWQKGEKEGRYPSALFNPLAYAHLLQLPEGISPTWHALNNKWNFETPVQLTGNCRNQRFPTQKVALFGHAVSTTVFGAERSLIDIASALFESGSEITLFLPSLNSKGYINELLEFVVAVVFIPLPWAKGDRKPLQPVVNYLEKHLTDGAYSYIYTNTITLLEPLLAAKRARVPSITHVRELVEYDSDLADILNESPGQTHQRVVQNTDYFIANSQQTAKWLSCPERTSVVYNCVNGFNEDKRIFEKNTLKICMLSSNVKKKGVEDFFKIAEAFNSDIRFQFTLYGPVTHEVLKAKKQYEKAAVNVAGYIDNPKAAIASHNIVLSLSSFQESFGRTVAEAMALGRVVVGYEWGAVAELLDSSSGCLVKYKDTEGIVSTLKYLMENQQELSLIGSAASQRAAEMFSHETFQANLLKSIDCILQNEKKK